MSQNTENIEARLCAYIDGELDDAARAEIEKHLAGNPQHRKLLDELMKTKALLVELPRATAPAEILESIQSHLERSVLLSQSGAEAASAAMRVRRWPQYSAAAAIGLLAIGLGAVVYFVLPSGTAHEAQFSLLEQPLASEPGAVLDVDEDFADQLALTPPPGTAMPATPDPVLEGPKDSSLSSLGRLREGATGEDLPLMGKSGDFKKAGIATADGETETGGVAADELQLDPFQAKVPSAAVAKTDASASKSAADENTMFMVVSTADASHTNEQVANFLTFNNIHWESVDEPMPNPMDPASMQRASAARLRQRVLELKMNDALQSQEALHAPTTAPVQEKELIDGRTEAAAADEQNVAAPEASRQAELNSQDRAPTTAPQNRSNTDLQKQMQMRQQRQAAGAGEKGNYYIARGVTKQQAAELYQQLNAEPAQLQQAAVIDNEALAVAPAEPQQPDAPMAGIDPGAEKAEVSKSRGYGFQPVANAPAATQPAAATQPTAESPLTPALRRDDVVLISIGKPDGQRMETIRTQPIAANGTVTIPFLGEVIAEGLTTSELEQAIARKYREAGNDRDDRSRITVRRLTDAEAAPSAVPARIVDEAFAAQGQIAQAGARSATTQPSTAPAAQLDATQVLPQQGEEKLDVVIVVQNRVAEPPAVPATTTTQPTTVPAEE